MGKKKREYCLQRLINLFKGKIKSNKKQKELYKKGWDNCEAMAKEYNDLEWTEYKWKGSGGYDNLGKGKNKNRFRETLYISPHCIKNTLF